MIRQKLPQFILILSLLAGCWLGMQAVHELGHVLGARLSGGSVRQVVLHPLTISRTDLQENPHPLITVWAGPFVGTLLPIAAWQVVQKWRGSRAHLWRFFAGFCCIANGAYLAFGSQSGIGDCGELLRHGASTWQLWLFGAVTIPLGLWLWHGQGRHFGFGPEAKVITWRDALPVLLTALALVVLGVLIDGR